MATIIEAPTSTTLAPETATLPLTEPPRWNLPTSLAFRFCFVYFGVYVLSTQMISGMLPIPGLGIPNLSVIEPFPSAVLFVGEHILGISEPISTTQSGSGDRLFNWVHAFTLLLLASTAALLWTLRAGGRAHPRLYKWFRLFIRLAVGTTWLTYGFSKVVPLQMPVLALSRLVEPFGNFSPMGVLWYSIGASPAYEIFIGAAEVAAGVLILVPRTATIGMFVALMDAIGVFALNMTYDVPVKLLAFHLILMALFLIAPNMQRLLDLFLRQKTTSLLPEPPLGRSTRAQRNSATLQLGFAVWVVCLGTYNGVQGWKLYGAGAPRSPLYGIWEVQRMSVDGIDQPLTVSDTAGIRRAIFQTPTDMRFQKMNDLFTRYSTVVDTVGRTLMLTPGDTTREKSTLTYDRSSRDWLVLTGTLNGEQVRMELSYRDPDSYLVRSRGFNWVQEGPFNR